jgi:Flp pilus assembly protein TadG
VFLIDRKYGRNLASDVGGVTAIEFALIAPVFVMLLMGIVEFSLIMFVNSTMEGATAASGRYGKTGYTAYGSSRKQQIIDTVAAKTNGLLNPSLINVTTTVYPSFDSISKDEPYIDTNRNGTHDVGEAYTDANHNGQWDSSGASGLGNSNDIVVYTVSYPWTINTPLIGSIFGNPFIISSRTVVKNEPY